MLAFIYLFLMCVLGDSICRRYFTFVSTPHRFAAAMLTGLLISSWWTYLCALLFAGTDSPMLWGNLVFFITASGLVLFLRSRPVANESLPSSHESVETEKWDWVFLGVFLLFSSWMMFSTFEVSDGSYHIGHHQFPDFGSTVSLMQSFAVGHNFPTEYPQFASERIRYHFLFYFQAGNLQYLGLDAALSNNILSVLTMTALLALVMTLGRVLFDSRVAGRIGAVLFFFHGSLAFIPYLYSQTSLASLWGHLSKTNSFLSSGWPYRGEDWGVWSQNVFLNQRHLANSIGLLLLILIFLLIRYRQSYVATQAAERDAASSAEGVSVDANNEEASSVTEDEASDPEDRAASEEYDAVEPSRMETPPPTDDSDIADPVENEVPNEVDDEPEPDAGTMADDDDDDFIGDDDPLESDRAALDEEDTSVDDIEDDEDEDVADVSGTSGDVDRSRTWMEQSQTNLAPFIFCGIVLGLMPMWNGAVFVSAFVVLACLLVLFPFRREMLVMAVTTAVLAVPQIVFLKTGARVDGYSFLFLGYTINDPSVYKVFSYLAFTFGLKWVLIAIALYFTSGLQRRLMVAVSALIVVAFCFRFSEEVLVNHKFINVWLVIANVFVAYGLVKLWQTKVAGTRIPLQVLAIILTLSITIGGLIDLVPIKNSYFISMKYDDDRLVQWVMKETDPRSIFLSHRYINHQILLAGRRLFYGEEYYAWGTGYDTAARDKIYRRMLESTNPQEVFELLKEYNIHYVAIDNMIRSGNGFIKRHNESLYQAYFKLVFQDTENRYGGINIYAVSETLGPADPNAQLPPTERSAATPEAIVDAFRGGVGDAGGQFASPRGIVADDRGDFYIADTGNARIQKFAADGKLILTFGSPGIGNGELKEPNGVAIDKDGNIFVTDSFNHKLLKYDRTGKFVKEWTPEGGFYGPRDIVFGPNKHLYIIDQGRTRIVKFDPSSEKFTAWGTGGSGEGQFNESTGIAIGDDLIYIADSGNQRVQVFDLNGILVKQWTVPDWEPSTMHFPDIVFDDVQKRVYVTSSKLNQILAFDTDGNVVSGHPGEGSDKLQNPSSLAISVTKTARKLLVLNTGGSNVTVFELENKKSK